MKPSSTPDSVLLEDQAMRDGLQMESRIFSLEEKVELFALLRRAGIPRIQVGSFVHPRIVPQMADTDALIQALGEQGRNVVSVLILNARGLARALACGVRHGSMSVSVSDTHSRKNARQPAAAALAAMTDLIAQALSSGVNARGGLQCAFGCVYEGAVPESTVLKAAEKMARSGVQEINLADTTGMATPPTIRSMLKRFEKELPEITISLHLHDTRGLGLANLFAGYEAGVRSFDVCSGGLGGCPFVKGAAGNVPTEDAVNLLEAIGVTTGIHLPLLCEAVAFLEKALQRQLPGRMNRVLKVQQTGM